MTDLDLIDAVLEADGARGGLNPREREAFASMRDDGRPLTDPQAAWLQTAAQRLGVVDCAPAANVFSSMSEAKRREELRSVRTRLPWEGKTKVLKPPGRA